MPPQNCTHGRGYPDLSMIGAAVPVVMQGVPNAAYGTSISAPTFAGLVDQLNAAIRATPEQLDDRVHEPLPVLYWAAANYPIAFYDGQVGSNKHNANDCTACGLGYTATVGWDAVTGLGMPNMTVLQTAAIRYIQLQMASNS